MALKALVEKIEDVPEAFRGEYEATGTGTQHRLKIDGEVPGFVPKAKLDEFRTNNTTLTEELKTTKQKLEALKDIDPEEYKRLKEKRPSETEKDYQNRLDAALTPLKTENETLKTRNQTLEGELSKLKINDAALAAGVEFGIRPAAQEDLINRVSKQTKIENGIVIVLDEKGEKRYSTKTGELMSIKELVAEMAEKTAHLFEPSTGTGSNGGGNGGSGGRRTSEGPNPWDPKTRNITRQSEISKENPERAKQMAAAHGINLVFPGVRTPSTGVPASAATARPRVGMPRR